MWALSIWFLGSLVVCLLLVKLVPGVNRIMSAFAGHMAPRAFSGSSAFEHNKFALLRVLFGLILLARGLDVYELLLYSERFSAVGLWAGAEMLAGVLLALGLLTQWVLVFLIGAMWQYGDVVVAKSTLGNDIGAILAILLLLVNAGKYLSLDYALLKRLPNLRWSLLYYNGARLAHIYGITPIDVFNKKDLRMAENWFVLDSADFYERVPLFAEDGSRLSMHASDRIYFGHTLRFRRAVIDKLGCHFESWRPLFEYMSLIYLQQRGAKAGEYDFKYRQFNQPLVSAEDIARNQFKSVAPKLLCALDYKIAYRK